MLRVSGSATASVRSGLKRKQDRIDSLATFPERVAAAKKAWKSKSSSKKLFADVRELLSAQSPGLRRCVYCEDSMADEIEHVHPKDWRPDLVFVFTNYVFACGPCNGPKSNRYGIVVGAGVTEVQPTEPLIEPVGAPALLHPREVDPLDFLELDLDSTFLYLPRLDLDALGKARAELTIDVLHLNDRETLTEGRREAFTTFRHRLEEAAEVRADGGDVEPLGASVRKLAHLTVFHEMRRQREWFPKLRQLFDDVPEALAW
ncbi:MAG: hypothetical protein R3F61_12905 [Myxococcota bacterium]